MSKNIDIKALRDRLGWTQEQMAEYLGLDRSSVSRMEGGQTPKGPTEKLLAALASKQSGGRVQAA
jgi:transcriptional regulator with XRE-family HTH domain